MENCEYELEEELKFKEPDMSYLFLLNDNVSTVDFVVDTLIKIFRKSKIDAEEIMNEAHNNGKALCGIYTREIAVTKVMQVEDKAKEFNFPLKVVISNG